MKVWVNITTADGEVLERFAVLSDDVRRNDPTRPHSAIQVACDIKNYVGHRFEVDDEP